MVVQKQWIRMNGIWISLTSYCRWWQILLYTVGESGRKTRSEWL